MANKNKLKTHKGVLKRVKVTAKGKVKHKRAGKSHLMSCHNGKFVREKRKDKIAHPTVQKTLKDMMRGF